MPLEFPEKPPIGSPNHYLFLIVVLVFGVVATAGGIRWLVSGRIVIREAGTRVGAGGGRPPPVADGNQRVAGAIEADHLLYYPLCITCTVLGLSMVALAALAFLTAHTLFFKLSAYSCLALFLFAFATVATALWSGP